VGGHGNLSRLSRLGWHHSFVDGAGARRVPYLFRGTVGYRQLRPTAVNGKCACSTRDRRNIRRSGLCAPEIDIFEGAQQTQQLIVARRILGKTSTELR
jgi:hypothetical protein